jgi:multidrug efflux pump subunit AcrA (membrane-fusion protein)
VDVANPDGVLRAGMFAKGTIVTEKSNVHPLLPLGAVRKDNGRDVVYRIDNGKIVAQPVKLGLRNQDEGVVEALEGVDAGMTVLAVPLDGIKPGSKVKLPDTKG